MRVLDRLERRFGRFAIRNLMTYIVGLNAAVFIMTMLMPGGARIGKLVLDPAMVMKGEYWRLITYIFIPPTFSLLWIIVTLYFYYLVGTGLESAWGSFRFNVYYLIGMLGTTAAAFLSGGIVTAFYLNLSLFLAFAWIFPDFQVLLFFVLPIKVKYLGWLNAAYLGFSFLVGDLTIRLCIAAAMGNFFLFFGKDLLYYTRNRRRAYSNRRGFQKKMPPPKEYFHRCTVCGMTEKDGEDMEFRFCSGCEGNYEYCMDHLKNHEHIRKETAPGQGAGD